MAEDNAFGGILGVFRYKQTIQAFNMGRIRVRVLINGALYEDSGTEKYDWGIFPTIERAYKLPATANGKGGKVAVIDDTDLKYDSWLMYKVIQTRVAADPILDYGALRAQFIIGMFIGVFAGAAGSLVGMRYLALLFVVIMVYRMVNRSVGYAKS